MRKVISILLIMAVFSLQSQRGATYADTRLSKTPLFQKGMSFVTWSKDRYMSPHADESLLRMKEIGVEWVSIVITWYQKEYNSKKISPSENTPSDESVEYVIKKAHEIGLKVMLKPHLDLLNQEDTLWRGDIGFAKESDWEEWFREYTEFMLRYARIAERTGVEIFCLGTELTFAATEKPDMWRSKVIPEIREAYSGALTYAANWHDEFDNIKFWDDLDYAGLDAYFPLSKKNRPAFEEIKSAWEEWLPRIQEWQRQIRKPVIFTEVGYCSVEGAARKPWDVAMSGAVDLEIQANCYRALLEVFWEKEWFYGVYWWKWNTNIRSGGKSHRRFTPQNKPAQDIVARWYKNKGRNTLENAELVRYTYN